ncbi:MAG TPA: glycosyltransferase N-terminal domain-containing protein [Candidatus Kapabacteria bacterium]|nr:glycosyltransferase N-terminal domain-containing protein [Candidatus Kapabacteria bacterium]
MLTLYKIIYNNLFIPLLRLFIDKNLKSKNIDRNLSINVLYQELSNINNEKKRIWFHASSMGEFEQAKPIIEALKEIDSNLIIICTFFSPSGYENQKDYKYADFTSYIIYDNKRKVEEFVEKIKPDIAIFVRYDLWINILNTLKINNIKTVLINATIPSVYFKPYYKLFTPFYQYVYQFFYEIYCFNANSLEFFKGLRLHSKLILSSDTRLDRISKVVNNIRNSKAEFEYLKSDKCLNLIVGSSWEYDENLIIEAVQQINRDKFKVRIIFVPHKPNKENVNRLKSQLGSSILYSQLEAKKASDINVIQNSHIIIDKIGILLKLYSIADIAYVGCGFGDGVHSTAEPAGYGLPIISGPNIKKSPDAVELNKLGALMVINNVAELVECINILIENQSYYSNASLQSFEYINKNIGSTEVITNRIIELIK